MVFSKLTKLVRDIEHGKEKHAQKYAPCIQNIDKAKEPAIQNLLAFLSYRDVEVEFKKACQELNLPIKLSGSDRFLNELQGLKKLLGITLESQEPNSLLEQNVQSFFGIDRPATFPRLMVNLRQEAENDAAYLAKLIENGVHHFRLNCAFGGADFWNNSHRNLTQVAECLKQPANLLFDMAGPKIRVDKLFQNQEETAEIYLSLEEDLLIATSEATIKNSPDQQKSIVCRFSGDFSNCRPNELLRFDDSRFEARITKVESDSILVSITKADVVQNKLLLGKGINFPQSDLGISGLTQKDREDLASVINLDCTLCFSFVQSAEDILDIEKEITKHRPADMPIVIKIETFKAIQNLPSILLAAMRFPRLCILIARGDLVSECGWKELPAIQFMIEEHARAAQLPIILATEILEGLNQNGQQTRPEMLDLHLAQRYDCILLNKGENIFETVGFVGS